MSEPADGGVQVPQPIEVLHGGGSALACDREGRLVAEERHGLFAGDTRVLSTYRIGVGGGEWDLLSRTRPDAATARWNFQNPAMQGPALDLAAGTLLFTITRRLSGALRDELRLCAFAPARLRVTLHLDADFADIFEVKDSSYRPRLNVLRVPAPDGVTLLYERKGFRRGLRVRFRTGGPPPDLVGTQAVFDLELTHGAEWTCRLEACPILGHEVLEFRDEPTPAPNADGVTLAAGPPLDGPFARGRADLRSLAVARPGHPPYPAAGVPWFLTLFGRDTLLTALMAGLDGSWPAEGALAALGERQARERDDFRDAEPGKFPHEVRRGELAVRGEIPHAAYYGAHDVPALCCLALWHAWRWTGKRALLDAHFDAARRAIEWCEQSGDRDGDGLQEYETRSTRGYYNQSWKDSGDAIVHDDGRRAAAPLATIELQGYLFAARLAMAELYDERGDAAAAERQRRAARELRARVEERFWMEDRGFYALALDRDKRPVTSISSNPGHLLWSGLPGPERAARVAGRLMRPDMVSGWGLRTLSSDHRAYNPLSYQCGSVWPFDTALAAAGMWRYGLRDEAAALLRAVLEAASRFEGHSLPELFCGIDRARGQPVPYERANRPQAWSAAVPILAAQLVLGIVPDAPRGRCFLTPWLPDWLPRLELRGIAVGGGRLDVCVARRDGETIIEYADARGVEVVPSTVEAPLWGNPVPA